MPLGLLAFEIFTSRVARWISSKQRYRDRDKVFVLLRNQCKFLSRARPNIGTCLLGVIIIYLVCSRLGPVLTRVGESNFVQQELKLFNDFKEQEAYRIFRDATRVPGLFVRRSTENFIVLLIMGNSTSRRDSSGNLKAPAHEPTAGDKAQLKSVDELGRAMDPETPQQDAPPSDKPRGSQSSEGDCGSAHKPVKFCTIEDNIATGDIAVLYREGQDIPHFGIFVQHDPCDPDFPLLLVKGKTKPMPLERFNPKERHAHTVSAVTRIFYGDYRSVVVRHLLTNTVFPCKKMLEFIDEVQKIPFTQKELDTIKDAKSPEERSAIVCAYMVAQFYKLMGMFDGDPTEVTPHSLQSMLNLSDPTYIKLPCPKEGPVVKGDPPLLSKLVEGIFPPPDVATKPLNSIYATLETGDIVLLSGATSSGAIIKFFDHSQFSHVGLVLKTKYSSHLLIWEASTNKAGLVDIESGKIRQGVELLPLRSKIFSGWYDRVAIRRLTGVDADKREEMYKDLLKFRKEVQGKPYEKSKSELVLSVINLQEWYLSFLRNTHEDLSSLFCSELVAAAYQRMGLLSTDKLPHEYTPDDFSSARDPKLNFGQLEKEVYIELKFDFDNF